MTPHHISPRESIYLDMVRALAAFVVVLDHAPTVFDVYVPRWGHQAVILFFVLSGYVISNAAEHRERTAHIFLVARFSRLWSVLVPAIALTIVCDTVGRHFGRYPEVYTNIPADHPVVRTLAALTFTSESWVSIQPFSDGVIWSLCCEFWYYIIFASYFFAPPGRWRVLALGVAVLGAGHKGLLLLPIWLFGVALQRLPRLRDLTVPVSAVLWGLGTVVIAWVLATRAYNPAIGLMQRNVSLFIVGELAQARVFWLDWLLGLAVAGHLLGARGLVGFIPFERIAGPVRWCAGVSFAAYLIHEPLLCCWAAWLPRQYGWIAIGLTLAAIGALGPPMEASKRHWRRALRKVADRLETFWPGSRLSSSPSGIPFHLD